MRTSFLATVGWLPLLLVVGLAFGEVGEVDISPSQNAYEGVKFSVLTEKETVHHNQFEIDTVVVAVQPGTRTSLAKTAYVEIWDGKQFVSGTGTSAVGLDQVPSSLREGIGGKALLLFVIRINPKFASASWINYQILRPDGSVEMNCIIHLKDFIPSPK